MNRKNTLAIIFMSAMLYGCATVDSIPETAMTTIEQPSYTMDDHFYLAATIWGEARGEGRTGMRLVAHIIKNRAANSRNRYGIGIKGVALKPKQFSCWLRSDPNSRKLNREYLATKLTGPDAHAWKVAQEVATQVLTNAPDITGGADHYHTTAVNPKWAREGLASGELRLVARVGSHIFYKHT